ncbi:MAG: TetR/AcrR family transcriptional regulator [Pseudomonas sp.]|uniref:TetR/AcrR family transcriptional regulator n=1 Tax=Pseudomonas sp. TaxID=306 RepID=UPI0033928FFA
MKNTSAPPKRGRPRQFDREQALQTALTLFWTHGYEGTSIAELVEALGIAPPSLYSAFGSKEQLFLEALRLYVAGPGNFVSRALHEESTGLGFIRRVLLDAAREFANGHHPPGCVIATGLVASASAHRQLAGEVAGLRSQTREVLALRIDQARSAGELSQACKPADLAGFYAAVIQGMSVQARDGADEASLIAIAEQALQSWPAAVR